MKEEIKEVIITNQNKSYSYFERDYDIPINTKKIITLVGSRRVGKTYILYQIIDRLKKEGIKKENILYFNFDDERFEFNVKNLKLVIESYFELYPNINPENVYLFFDEIQNINGWELFIRRIYDNYTKNIFLTGSSSKLLSKEIATQLRGRSLAYEIYPLSFKEYLKFKNLNELNYYNEKIKFKVKHLFNDFLLNGSYPETINFEEEVRIKTYRDYLNTMILRDIIERYNSVNETILRIFIKKVISNISREFSINKFYNQMKSEGFKISKDLVYEYPKYLEDIFLSYFMERYDYKILERSFSLKKLYLNDNGFVNLYKFSEDRGRLLENVVFVELKRRGKEIFYHKNKKECDFVIRESLDITEAIQVTQSLSDFDTRKRELQGIADALNSYNLKEGLILTEDEEEVIWISEKGKEIREERLEIGDWRQEMGDRGFIVRVKPVWKWLLE
jgi:hypothetical protein